MYEDNMSEYTVKDSGDRRDFGTGAVRDMGKGKGRTDLLPFHSLLELSKHFEAGAVKYGDENWRKGIPLRVYLDSAVRHLFKFALGMRDERHDLAAAWNVLCLIETQHMIDRGILPATLANLPNFFNADDGGDAFALIAADDADSLAVPEVGEDVKGLDAYLTERFPEDPNAPPAPQESLFREIAAERQYQDGKWGTANDDRNTANDWVSYIVRYATDAAPHDFDPANFRAKMVKVAALAVAAVEAQERNGGIPPRHYDGPDAPEPFTDKGDPIPVKVRKSLGLGEYPVDLRPQDRDYQFVDHYDGPGQKYTRGHADETAARFNAGQPYADLARLVADEVDMDAVSPRLGQAVNDALAGHTTPTEDATMDFIGGPHAVEYDDAVNAAEAISDHPLFSVFIIDGPDAAEYDEPDADPLADKAYLIVEPAVSNPGGQWFVTQDVVHFRGLDGDRECRRSTLHTRDSIRRGILTGDLRVVEAGLLE